MTGAGLDRRSMLAAATALPAWWCQPAPLRAAGTSFPLRVAREGAFLVDATGAPFLIRGDAAWSMIAQLRLEQAATYLQDRLARGFNTVLVSLLEHYFADDPPRNAYGDDPFLIAGDYGAPNEAYFARAEAMLALAAAMGFLVLLTPSYLGAGGGNEGWYQVMAANGPDKLRHYGRYVGARYRNLPNIVWLQGGDTDPVDKSLVRAIACGIAETCPDALQTIHCAPGTSVLEQWGSEPWLSLSNVYTYGAIGAACLGQCALRPTMPVLLLESFYENEHEVTQRRLRAQAYTALLSGGCGHVFGNNPIWHFGGWRDAGVTASWQDALASPGAQAMTHLHRLFAGLPWWSLVPSVDGTFVRGPSSWDGYGPVAAIARDRSFGIAYLPHGGHVGVDLDRLGGRELQVSWYDPTLGHTLPDRLLRAPTQGWITLHAPPSPLGGTGDQLLLLQRPT